jgi:hypothetical protein
MEMETPEVTRILLQDNREELMARLKK